MPHPLQDKIARIRRQSRRLLTVYALSRVAGSLIAALLLLGLVDYLIRFEDRGIRSICTLTALAVLVWAVYRYGYSAFGRRLGEVQLAQRIERRFPQLNDRLTSTIEFLNQSDGDAEAGSPALRRAVITETTAEVERLDFSEVLDRGGTRRALATAALFALLAIGCIVLDPASARIATLRLANPFGNEAWPKVHHLVWLKEPPTRLAVGQAFEVEVGDENHRLPDQVRIHYRYDEEDPAADEVEPMHLLDRVMVARKDNVTRGFAYRAEGGDDRAMDWVRLEVIEPPRIDGLRLKLHPPAYTGWPPQPSDRNIHTLRGARVEIEAATTKPIVAASLHQPDAEPIAAQINADGRGFRLSADATGGLVIDKSGPYWFEMTDDEGVTGGASDRWEIQAVADQPPAVTIEQPAANIFVTPDAALPLRVLARDDLAIRSVALQYSRSDRTDIGETTLPLLTGPAQTAPAAAGLSGVEQGESRVIEQAWELSTLALKPGVQLNFFATAGDYSPQTGRSAPRRLTIITPQELEDRIAQRQALILAELGRVLKMQQEARGQVAELEIQLGQIGALDKQQIDHARGAELNQRQVARTLTSPTEGVQTQISDLLSDLRTNKVDSPEVHRRMQGISGEINRLEKEHLSAVERDLTSAIKGAQAQLGQERADAQVAQSLASAGRNQDAVVQSLESMLGELSQWDSYRRFGRDVAQMRREQEELEQKTRELGAKTLGKELKDLDPQQQADLRKLAAAQQDLARRFDKLGQQMDAMRERLKDGDPLASQTIADALHHARQQSIAGQMRQAGGHVEQNQLGQAAERHRRVNQDLDEMSNILANRRERELSRLVKKLREAEQQLEDLHRQQQGLRKKMAAAGEKTDAEARKRELERLVKQQKQLQEEAQRFARRLERLEAQRAARATSAAAAKMAGASAGGEKGECGEACEQSEKAEKDLDEAQQQLAQRRRQAEADLAREQMTKIADSIRGLHERQQNVVRSTEELQAVRLPDGQFERKHVASLRDLAREQKSLLAETRSLAEKVAAAEVFRLALDGAGEQMGRAAELLDKRETAEATQRAENNALARFAQLLEALKKSKSPASRKAGGEGGEGGESPGQQDGIQSLAELKLLKLLQEDLRRRVQSLSGSDDQTTDELAQAYADLAKEQGRLAELALKLSEPVARNPEDEPEKLPDIRLDGPDKTPAGAASDVNPAGNSDPAEAAPPETNAKEISPPENRGE